ncbi:MAG: serine protease [Acidimicrobiia bacterium]|nr:serine protease [Acidimicrobiia bacterium]
MVAGPNGILIDETRESLLESVGDNQVLDAWYADLGDPAIGALLQQPETAEAVAEVVIGKDDRVRVNNTTAYPWRAICSLRITARDGSRWIGSGFLVGNRTVITAGHVVYMHSRGGWVRKIEVIPGRNGSSKPFGSCDATAFHSVKGWTQKKKRSHDYAAIILPKNCALGKRVGFFGYANYSFFTLLNMLVNLAGYPGDKPAGTMWWHARRLKWITSRTLVYNIDTAGGQSGAPVWRKKGSQRYAVGIHTNGSSGGNSATRITKPVFNNIKKWKALGA